MVIHQLQRDLYLEQSVRVLRALQVQYWYCMAGGGSRVQLEAIGTTTCANTDSW